MALSKKDYTIIKVAQATHPQLDFRCGTSMVYSDHKVLFCKLTGHPGKISWYMG